MKPGSAKISDFTIFVSMFFSSYILDLSEIMLLSFPFTFSSFEEKFLNIPDYGADLLD